MSHRKQQVESQLKRVLSDVLVRDLQDPRVVGMVSITHVDVAPDMHEAFVYVSVLPDKYEKRTLGGLRHAAKHIHSLAFKRMAMRRVPRLDFRLDEQLKRTETVFEAIHRAMEQTGEEQPQDEQPIKTDGDDTGNDAAHNKPTDTPNE